MKYVTFGEIMMRLTPSRYGRFIQAESLEVTYAGAEANVAVDLAMLGCNVSFVTVLPDHELGMAAKNAVARYGVDVSDVIMRGKRMGVYFYEKGICHRAGKVIYDREGSSFALLKKDDLDWNKIFEGADWYHVTGITPALSAQAADATLRSVFAAKQNGMSVSCDLNYRSMLWSKEQAREVMKKLSGYTDVMITNTEQVSDVLDIDIDEGVDKDSDEAYLTLSRKIVSEYGCRQVAYTVRKSPSASHNIISGVLYDSESDRIYRSREYELTQIADRLGGGDSFGGGLIYALSIGKPLQYVIDFSVAAECLKHTVEGDFNLCTLSEIQSFLNGDGSIRVKR